jgi:hypothetical protein
MNKKSGGMAVPPRSENMKKDLKIVSVAIPKEQFRQILDYLEKIKTDMKEEPTVALFLRQAITDFLSKQNHE